MAWRDLDIDRGTATNADRKEAMQGRVENKVPVGLLAYANGEPVAWCSVAPRETYRNLGGAEVGEGEKVWSLVCFYSKREYRKQGLGGQFLKEAIKYAKKNKAKYLEAYPVNPDSPSYRFMGLVPLFEKAGFKYVQMAGSRRHVMLLEL